MIKVEGIEISRNVFKDLQRKCGKCFNGGIRGWINWPIFAFISPFKFCALIGILITLLLCGIGLYGLIVLILLILLFIFLP